jgi:hypothetical protein
VVINCTRKAPENRYFSMAQVLLDLEMLQAGYPIKLRSLQSQRDAYTPRTDHGQQASEVLAHRFGSYARIQEPHSRTRARSEDG